MVCQFILIVHTYQVDSTLYVQFLRMIVKNAKVDHTMNHCCINTGITNMPFIYVNDFLNL